MRGKQPPPLRALLLLFVFASCASQSAERPASQLPGFDSPRSALVRALEYAEGNRWSEWMELVAREDRDVFVVQHVVTVQVTAEWKKGLGEGIREVLKRHGFELNASSLQELNQSGNASPDAARRACTEALADIDSRALLQDVMASYDRAWPGQGLATTTRAALETSEQIRTEGDAAGLEVEGDFGLAAYSFRRVEGRWHLMAFGRLPRA